jgi:hypothetical protein
MGITPSLRLFIVPLPFSSRLFFLSRLFVAPDRRSNSFGRGKVFAPFGAWAWRIPP